MTDLAAAAPAVAMAAGLAWPLLARARAERRAWAALARSRRVRPPAVIPAPRAPAAFRH